MSLTKILAVSAALLMLWLLPAASGAPPAGAGERILERGYDGQGRLLYERGDVVDRHGVSFERFYHHAQSAARPGGGGGGGGGEPDPGTDCASNAYRAAPWKWSAAYAAKASAHADVFDAAARTWDDATGASLLAGIVAGNASTAGVMDGVNQFDFVDLGATSTIAVTTTWYNRFSHLAVESDGQYNTRYAWATDGRAGAMDVANIATHEIGHTFGLDHPKGGGIACLTMHAYGAYGETQKRTLGDGDILGIHALYGL